MPRLRQGDVLFNVPRVLNFSEPDKFEIGLVEFSVVITPDCDMERIWTSKGTDNKSEFSNVLLLEGTTQENISAAAWGKIKKHELMSAHAFEKCPSESDSEGIGFPKLTFNFKKVFGLPPDTLFQYIDAGIVRRRASLLSPFRDHLVQRYAGFAGRVALEREMDL